MRGYRRLVVAGAIAFTAAACGDSGGEPPVNAEPAATTISTSAPTATGAPTTAAPTTVVQTTVPPTTAAPAHPAIELGDPDASGAVPVSIDTGQLAPLFDAFMPGDDPFYLVHTQQEDMFIGVELYTVFGSDWTGQLGTFPTDCSTHGICVYLDPDGTGPLPGGGPGTGTITITQLEGGSIVTIDDIEITADDGQVYTMSGVTLTG